MSMMLRAAAATLLGFPPVFRRVKRLDPPPARVEPTVPYAPAPQPKSSGNGVDVERLLAATRNAAPVELSIIEWDGDGETAHVIQGPAPVEDAMADEIPMVGDARCRRIRDRYIGARFPGVAR